MPLRLVEGDLFDQLQLLQTLDRIAAARRRSRVTLVPAEGYLGLMSTGELMGCFARALEVAEPLLELARSGWAAFRSEDPRALELAREAEQLVRSMGSKAAVERALVTEVQEGGDGSDAMELEPEG